MLNPVKSLRRSYFFMDALISCIVLTMALVGQLLVWSIFSSNPILRWGVSTLWFLASAAILCGFQICIMRSAMTRISALEQELTEQTYLHTEDSRLKSLGEMAALAFHDIKQPIQLISYCVDEILENPEKSRKPEFWKLLTVANERALAITKNFNNYLRVSTADCDGTSLAEAHFATLRLLEPEMRKLYPETVVSFEPNLKEIRVDMSSPDLIHIFENLYRNALSALTFAPEVSDKWLKIACHQMNEKQITLSIANSGPSLQKSEFEAHLRQPANTFYETSRRQSLGLRLIYRLLKNKNGDLTLVESATESGTTFW